MEFEKDDLRGMAGLVGVRTYFALMRATWATFLTESLWVC